MTAKLGQHRLRSQTEQSAPMRGNRKDELVL